MRHARDGFPAARRPPAAPRRHTHARKCFIQPLVALIAVVASVLAVFASATRITSVAEFVSAPVVEILFPPNDFLVVGSDLDIEIAMRIELLREPVVQQTVCIGITAVHIPEDITIDVGRITERCYERDGNYTTFDASGLTPGVTYAVSAGLVNHGRVLGYSMRTIEVASIVARFAESTSRMSIAEAMLMAEQFHLSGDRVHATAVYHQVLKQFPMHVTALHRQGQVHYQNDQPRDAIDYFEKALEPRTNDASLHVSMALCLKALGRTAEAIQHFRRALELRPSYVHAALELGHLWRSQAKWDEAIHEYRKIITTVDEPPRQRQILEMDHIEMVKDALAWLCEVLRVTDGYQPAEHCLLQAVTKFPNDARFRVDRGHLLLHAGQVEAAQREYEVAADVGSVYGMMHTAEVLEAVGQYDASTKLYNEIYNHPEIGSQSILNQIAVMTTTVLPRILPATQDAIDLERDRFLVNVNAVIATMNPDMHPILLDPSRIAFSTAVTMNAHNRNNRQLKRLVGEMYHALLVDPVGVREEYVHSYGLTPPPFHQRRNHDHNQQYSNGNASSSKRLRVGFVSRFFFNPAVGLFMNELLPQLNTTKYEVFAFGIGLSKSFKTYQQVEQIAEHVVALPRDLRVARDEIRAHEMDLLIYPELGMDKTTYFLSFYRLAPVQAAWWGNPDTSGVPNIDVFLTSEHEHASFRDHYTEPVHQMEGLGIYHTLPPLPNITATRIASVRSTIQQRLNLPTEFHLYLSIESMLHLHPDFDEALRRILDQDPLAHVCLLGSSNRKKWKQLLLSRIETHIGAQHIGRVSFFSDVDARQEIHLLSAADVVLASLHLTSPRAAMQAFTAGVPVVTLTGERWASRITAALYTQMKIKDLTATTLDEYVELAVRLATNENFRARMVRKIRRHRGRLSNDATAVRAWESFCDLVQNQVKPTAHSSTTDDDGQASEETDAVTTTESAHEPRAATMDQTTATCPATSLWHLW